MWDEKNRKEQDYVASYIRRQLLSLGIHSTENGPYPAYAGALSHLKTDFRFSLKDNKGLGDLLKVLHPTPAVCGLPKEEAYRFILQNEGYDRRYYSGFIGWLDPEGRTDIYVNLRCMHIEDEQLTLYAGGGLLASSELNDEWLETEKKLQTIKRLIATPPLNHKLLIIIIMYTDKKNILQLVALLEAHGITKVVLCPGSRNTPIVHTLSNHPNFTCYPVTDERSAGYFAIGLALNGGKPAAVCCTSGTALLNLHPAVAEAFYQNVPLVVISADRPAAWIGQMDGQTVPQPGVFQTLVKKSVNLPEIHTEEDEWYCNRLVNEALLETNHHGKGPVHINVPISEPLFQFTVDALPEVRVITRYQGLNVYDRDYNDLVDRMNKYQKRMIIIGQMNLIYLFEKDISSYYINILPG